MRSFITFFRILKLGFINFIRNAWLSTAATAIMLVTLGILLSGLLINKALSGEIKSIVSDVTISIYFKENFKETQMKELKSALISNSNVKSVNYISKQHALDIFAQQSKNDPTLLEGLTIGENAVPASLEVKVHDLSKIKQVALIAENARYNKFVDETSYDEQSEERIQSIAAVQKFIVKSSIVAGVAFAFISVLIIFNTIRMAIFTRGEEIKIMKLIGATNSYIRGPFLFEASLYGIVAGSIASGLLYGFLYSWGTEIAKYLLAFQSTLDFFQDNMVIISLTTLLCGILIGLISSILALTRYLKLR